MRNPDRLLVVALCCAAAAWLAGPAGRLLVALPLLLFGPGYLLERASARFDERSLALRPAVWLGLSLSIVALIYEWATTLGLSLTLPALYALAAACGLGIIWRFLREQANDDRRTTTDDQRTSYHLVSLSPRHLVSRRWSLALLAILALTLWTRVSQIGDLVLPAWVDSVHHALMIRVAAELGQAPYSLRPYLPVDQLPYHWGYHVFSAAVMQLSGLSLATSMLWVGQVLNALQALVAAALAAFLWRRPLAGVVAALVVGLLSIMPAYYVSWGRYTQLTGLLLLPALAIAWRSGLRAPSIGKLICTAVLLAGLSLIHFRILVFALTLMAASGAAWACVAGRTGLRARLGYVAASAGLALALAAPWLWLLARRTLFPAFAQPSNLVSIAGYGDLTTGLLWAGHNRILIALALAAALWALARRRGAAAEIAGWVAGLALLANPVLLGLPYIWLITNDVVVICLFLPVGVLLGGGACLLADWIERETGDTRQEIGDRSEGDRGLVSPVSGLVSPASWSHSWAVISRRRAIVRGMGLVPLAALALWGAWDLRQVINPDTVLAGPADLAAIAWAGEHTPADARFLINAVPWLGSYRGADGGWWLLPLAGRWVSTPPILFTYGAPDYTRATRANGKLVSGYRAGQEQQIFDLIARERITYIYLGRRPGALTPQTFAGNPEFETVYERDGVTILAVHR